MKITDRSTQTVWQGSLTGGSGTLGSGSSGVLDNLPVTWVARTEQPGGKTSPEELLAAAHSSCYSMALAATLGEHKAEPERLEVNAVVTLSEIEGKPTIDKVDLTVRATIPGMDTEDFTAVIDEASALCPVSRLFAGATISVDAALV